MTFDARPPFELLRNGLEGFYIVVMRHNEREDLLEISIWEGPNHIQGLFLLRYTLSNSPKILNYATHSS